MTAPLPAREGGTPKRITAPLPGGGVGEPGDVRSLVREIAVEQDRYEEDSAFRAGGGAFRRLRAVLAAVVVVVAAAVALLPGLDEYGFQRDRVRLAERLEAIKGRLEQESPGVERLRRWLAGPDIEALRRFYAGSRSELARSLRDAGFPASEHNVTLRLDDGGGGLVLAAQFERDDGRLLAWEVPVGGERPAPPAPEASLGAALAGQLHLLVALEAVALALVAAAWILPRRRRRAAPRA